MRISVRGSDTNYIMTDGTSRQSKDIIIFDNVNYIRVLDVNTIMFIDSDGEDHYIFNKDRSNEDEPETVMSAIDCLNLNGWYDFTDYMYWSYLDEGCDPVEKDENDDTNIARDIIETMRKEQEEHNERI